MAVEHSDEFDKHTTVLARYAKALSHPARISILRTLAQKKRCICGEIVEVLPLAQSTVSQHLAELKDAKLIRGEIEGLKSCYCLNPEAIEELNSLLSEFSNEVKKGLISKKCC